MDAMRRAVCAILTLCLTAPALAETADSTAPAAPRRVKVLWLGDLGHHKPLERCRQAFSTFAGRGIDFTYTSDPADLNAQTLGRYDCLLLYANIERITPEQEKALLEYVESGRGFVPVHCASFCFKNSPQVTALTGARFKRHGTGVFKETVLAPNHPIEKGLKPIESWDETYVHEMHNEQDRTVLGERVEGDHREPYTWVRTHGRGRVFYTAWGHDERTWGNADFQNLLEHGIRWAAGDWAMTTTSVLPPAEMVKSDSPLPNYLPDQKWGVEGGNIFEMQKPLTPAESIRRMVLPPGFRASLVASDPDIYKPICMAFDERGRMWIAETVDYPNDIQPSGKGNDRIKICTDTDGDGRADSFRVFADKLSIPTSLCFANGGVIVTQAPDTLFLKDTDGDDVADERRVLFTGWSTDDTHAGPSNLRYGFDNWIYGTIGYAGFRGIVGGKDLSFRQGIFRMKPDGSRVEFLGNTNNNTWGLGFSEDGDVFASTANRNPSFHLAVPNRYFESVNGMRARPMELIADSSRIFPTTPAVRQMDHHGNFTAAAGHALYTARSFPREYWNRIAFVTEPTAHLIAQFVMEPSGSTFTARNDFNLLASDDGWTSPIVAEVGPDGGVWFIDWYNYIVQHNPVPHGFEKGKGNAYVTPLRDKTHGRVYRLTWDQGKPSKTLELSKASAEQLVAALGSDNQLWRMHAQRLLVERGDTSVIPALAKLAADPSVDAIGLNTTAIHALWTIHGLGGFEVSPVGDVADALSGALKHASPGVRKTAAEVASRSADWSDKLLASGLLNDNDPNVRRAALLSLAEMPGSDAAGAAVYAILAAVPNDPKSTDHWLTDAASIAAARHDAGFLRALFAAHGSKSDFAKTPPAPAPNLIANPSFEDARGDMPIGWRARTFEGEATHVWDHGGRTGERSLRIDSKTGSDTSWFTDVPVQPNATYRLSAWIKTENLTGTKTAKGALLNVHRTEDQTNAVIGTSPWRRVETTFNTGRREVVSINCLFGGWGEATGSAWYDDVELTLIESNSLGLSKSLDGAVRVVSKHYASRAPTDSIVATLAALRGADAKLATAILENLAAGWPERASPKLSDADRRALSALMASLSTDDARGHLLSLADRWGRRDLFATEATALADESRKTLADAKADPAARAEAARRLISADDGPASTDAILKLVVPTAPPQLQTGLLDALALSKSDATGSAIVARWPKLTPTAQAAALGLLLQRSAWSASLVDALEAGSVNPRDLKREHWQILKLNPDPALSSRAAKLEKAGGRASNPDKQKVIDALLPLLNKPADAALGQQVFTKTCAVCHALEGQGGKVGPDLTGIGSRPKGDLLVEIVDPNRSVEGTYRQWLAQTRDQVIAGRLLSESQTGVEIIDASGVVHSLERSKIVRLTASAVSVMPEGLEQMSLEEMASLLEFLSKSNVRH